MANTNPGSNSGSGQAQTVGMGEIILAHHALKEVIRRTPLLRDPYLSKKYGCEVFL